MLLESTTELAENVIEGVDRHKSGSVVLPALLPAYAHVREAVRPPSGPKHWRRKRLTPRGGLFVLCAPKYAVRGASLGEASRQFDGPSPAVWYPGVHGGCVFK